MSNAQIGHKSRSEVRKTIVDFVRSEYRMGRTVHFLDIIKKFRISLPYYFRDPWEIYIYAGVEVPTRLAYKDEIRKEIIKFFKEYYRIHRVPPTKMDVRKVLHVDVYNYFKNTLECCEKAGIKPRSQSLSVEIKRKLILDFIRKMSKKGKYPPTKDIENKFRVELETYFHKPYLINAYKKAGVDYRKALKERNKRIQEARERRKIFKTVQEGRDAIAEFIKNNVRHHKYPTFREIQKNLNSAFYGYFNSVKEAYEYSGVDYKRTHIFLAREKEEKLTKIVIELLKYLGWKITWISIFAKKFRNRGIDILAVNNQKLIGIEIKAYHKSGCISVKEIKQTLRNVKHHNCDQSIIITTTNNIPKKCPKNIEIWNYSYLITMLKKAKIEKFMENILWIRNRIIEIEKREVIKIKRKEIINYMTCLVKNNHHPTKAGLEQHFNINLRTYFKSLRKVYEIAGLAVPKYLMTKNEIKNEMINFVRENVKNEIYPTVKDIQNKFNINVSTYFGRGEAMKRVYQLAGIEYMQRKKQSCAFFPR